MNNAQYLVAVSKLAPELGKTLSSLGNELFTEKGFERVNNLPEQIKSVTWDNSLSPNTNIMTGLQSIT